MTRRRMPIDEGFRHTGDFGQGPRFPWGFAESRVPLADASYQGYGAYATLDGTRVDESEYAELDYTGMELEPELTPPEHSEEICRILPESTLLTVTESGHLTPLEHPTPVNDALLDFLERADRRAGS